jgi:hypothetical protein
MEKKVLPPPVLDKRFIPVSFVREAGFLWAYGIATSEAIDSYGTVFSMAATREAAKDWDKWRNLRDMHDPKVAGVVPIIELTNTEMRIGAKILDSETEKKADAGGYKGFSIRFGDDYDGHWEVRDGRDVFIFTRYELVEISLVDRPSNPEALITLFSRADFALADKDANWIWDWTDDADRIIEKLGMKGLASVCLYYDKNAADDDGDGYPDGKSAYRLPVAKLMSVDDANPILHLNACRAAMAELNGANGGIDISDEAKQAAYGRLKKYYKLFDETPPDLRKMEDIPMDKNELLAIFTRALDAALRKVGIKAQDPAAGAAAQTTPAPSATTRVTMPKAELDQIKKMRKDLEAAGAAKEDLARVDEAMTLIDEIPEVATGADVESTRVITDQNAKIATLQQQVNDLASARKSQQTVSDDDQKPKSRYRGVFIPYEQ